MATTTSRKPRRTCKGCGKRETRSALGFTDIAPALGYCVECIHRAMETCPDCGGSRERPAGCAGCCRDCGRPCSFEKDGEGFHVEDE